jgi:vacuolar iron transporter family protein
MKSLKPYVSEILFGGSDGIVTTFALVAGFIGSQSNNWQITTISPSVLILFALSNVFADGLSMGLGSFQSNNAHIDTNGNNRGINSIVSGVITFCSFILFGIIPILPFFFFNYQMAAIVSVVAMLFALIMLGLIRFALSRKNLFGCILQSVGVGSLASAAAFVVGVLFRV